MDIALAQTLLGRAERQHAPRKMTPAEHRAWAATHCPPANPLSPGPPLCAFCTRVGVGNHQGPVPHPCGALGVARQQYQPRATRRSVA